MSDQTIVEDLMTLQFFVCYFREIGLMKNLFNFNNKYLKYYEVEMNNILAKYVDVDIEIVFEENHDKSAFGYHIHNHLTLNYIDIIILISAKTRGNKPIYRDYIWRIVRGRTIYNISQQPHEKDK